MKAKLARKGEWLEIRFDSASEQPADERAATLYPLPDGLLRRLRQSGGVQTGETFVRLRLFPAETADYAPEWMELDVLYEDDYCLVVAKPAGVKVHPSQPGETGTLANGVAYHYESTGQSCRVRHIHRLDEQTTGPVLYAKNELAQLHLDEAMRRKLIERLYVAVAAGRMSRASGTIDAPIGRDRHHAGKRRVSPTGERAVTHYEVAGRLADATLVRLRLATGRTHQIRVHMSHIGHPLLGDPLYGGETSGGARPQATIARQALHGETLVFPHPWTGQPVRVEAPWPDDLVKLVASLRHKTQPPDSRKLL